MTKTLIAAVEQGRLTDGSELFQLTAVFGEALEPSCNVSHDLAEGVVVVADGLAAAAAAEIQLHQPTAVHALEAPCQAAAVLLVSMESSLDSIETKHELTVVVLADSLRDPRWG